MSRTFKKDKFGNKVRDYQKSFYKCRCESCTKRKYKLKNTISKKEIKQIINDTTNNNFCIIAIGI